MILLGIRQWILRTQREILEKGSAKEYRGMLRGIQKRIDAIYRKPKKTGHVVVVGQGPSYIYIYI